MGLAGALDVLMLAVLHEPVFYYLDDTLPHKICVVQWLICLYYKGESLVVVCALLPRSAIWIYCGLL